MHTYIHMYNIHCIYIYIYIYTVNNVVCNSHATIVIFRNTQNISAFTLCNKVYKYGMCYATDVRIPIMGLIHHNNKMPTN